MKEAFVTEIKRALGENSILLHEPMEKHTTFEIGGPADYVIFPSSIEDVKAAFSLLRQYEIPFLILGNGSNVLVRDKGIRGAVVVFNALYSKMRADGNRIIAEAGASLKDISKFAASCGLSGIEFAVGIPGSLGGAVFMNAGAYDGEMKNVVRHVTSLSVDGTLHEWEFEQLKMGYRHSIFQENDQVICEVILELSPGNKESILEKMDDFTKRREMKQPLEYPSAGSTFKRPEGYFAGTLIDQTGLKGLRVGGAQVSEKHAGFVINAGDATAENVLELISKVQKRVFEKHGVKLYPEVRVLGEE